MADRVAVFNQGRLEQFGTPSQIYDDPASLFVNTFVGAANVLRGRVEAIEGRRAEVVLDGGERVAGRAMQGVAAGDPAIVCIRPEQIRRAPGGMPATIEISMPLGSTIVHEARLADGTGVKLAEPREAGTEPLQPGTQVTLAPASTTAANVFKAT